MSLLLILFLLCSIANTTPQPYNTELPPTHCVLLARIKEFRTMMYGIPEELFKMERLIKFSEVVPVGNRTKVTKEVGSLSKLRENYLQHDMFEYAIKLSNLEMMISSFVNDDNSLTVGDRDCPESNAQIREIEALKKKLEQLETQLLQETSEIKEHMEQSIEEVRLENNRTAEANREETSEIRDQIEGVEQSIEEVRQESNRTAEENRESGRILEQETSEIKEDIEGVAQSLEEVRVEINTTRQGLTQETSEMKEDIEGVEQSLEEVRVEINTTGQELNQETSDIKDDIDTLKRYVACRLSPKAKWHLGMNLNPADGHIMDYTTGWAHNVSIGSDDNALSRDYLNQSVWREPANYIAIVRHQSGTVDAVKVFQFTSGGISLLQRFYHDGRFNDSSYYRSIVTNGGPIQETISSTAPYMTDDPIFSVDGDLAFNWVYSTNGVRVVLTGGHLSGYRSDRNTHGLGSHNNFVPNLRVSKYDQFKIEISVIQDCAYNSACWYSKNYKVMGTDHGGLYVYNSIAVYGNYAIYVSQDATTFPEPGHRLALEIGQCD